MATGSALSRPLLSLLLAFFFVQQSVLVEGKCCENKVVGGTGPKSGYYSLVMTSDTIPEFCIGGCVYTKKDDPEPGTMYCFQAGDMDTTCKGGSSSGGCGEVKEWIEKYFKKECAKQVNKVLEVETYESDECSSSGCWRTALDNATVKVFESENCVGKPFMEMNTEAPKYTSCWSGASALFFLSVQKPVKWSVWVGKEGYKPQCQELGILTPFGYTTYRSATLEKPTIPIVQLVLNFTWEASPELFPDVMVQTTPLTCINASMEEAEIYGPGYGNIGCNSGGSGFGSGSGYFRNGGNAHSKHSSDEGPKPKRKENNKPEENKHKPGQGRTKHSESGSPFDVKQYFNNMYCSCAPTCEFVSWVTDYNTDCDCRGVAAGGLNFTEMTYPDSTPPFGLAKMKGSIYWYNTESDPYMNYKYSLVYGKFSRRSGDEPVCDSKMNLTLMYPGVNFMINRSVPCFTSQIPPTTIPPFYPGSTPGADLSSFGTDMSSFGADMSSSATQTSSPGALHLDTFHSSPTPGYIPEFTNPPVNGTEDNFSEVDGVLIYGGGDMYWMVGCMASTELAYYLDLPDFFTSKNPADTPAFCGCLYSIIPYEFVPPFVPSVKEVKWCYMEALYMGKSFNFNRNMGRSKEEKTYGNEPNTFGRDPEEGRKGDQERPRHGGKPHDNGDHEQYRPDGRGDGRNPRPDRQEGPPSRGNENFGQYGKY